MPEMPDVCLSFVLLFTNFYYCCYAKTSTSAVQKRHSKVYGNPIAPSFYSILLGNTVNIMHFTVVHIPLLIKEFYIEISIDMFIYCLCVRNIVIINSTKEDNVFVDKEMCTALSLRNKTKSWFPEEEIKESIVK